MGEASSYFRMSEMIR